MNRLFREILEAFYKMPYETWSYNLHTQLSRNSMKTMATENLTWKDFMKVEMRVGTIVSAEKFKEARNPAYKLIIDFGDLGKMKTSAQITDLYDPEAIVGKQVIAVVNFPPKQIANMMSECLVLGGIGENKEVTLIEPERKVKNGTRIG